MIDAPKVRADQITHALSKRHGKDIFLTEVKTDSTWAGKPMRIDAVAIKPSWVQPCISGYEVKVSRSDFMADDKYGAYLPLCHKFSFACPSGLIKPDELHKDIGLIWYKPETGGLVTKRKPLYKPLDQMPAKLLYYIVLSRTDSDRHPFFSDAREYCEAWLEDKAHRLVLSQDVRRKVQLLLTTDLKEAQDQVKDLERLRAEHKELWEILYKHCIYHTHVLEQILTSGLPPAVVDFLEWAQRRSAQLLEEKDGAA